jgi:putative transposase
MGSTFHKLCYHIIFSTKHRQPIISDEIQKELYPYIGYIGGIVNGEKAWLLEIGGMPDQGSVHFFIDEKTNPKSHRGIAFRSFGTRTLFTLS